MTTKKHADRKDTNSDFRCSLKIKNTEKYTTKAILSRLLEERPLYEMIADNYLTGADDWIEKFRNYPEIEFYFILERDDFMVDVLTKYKAYIEATVYPQKRRGRSLLSKDKFRSKRISVYFSADELEKLDHSANSENMKIPEFLRQIGLNRKIPPKPAKLDLEAYSILSRTASNLNQIAKHLNSHPEAVHELDTVKSALSDFRRSLISARTEGNNEE